MGNSMTERLRVAAEGLVLTDAQKHVLAYRLSRKLRKEAIGEVAVSELLGMIDSAMHDMATGVDMTVVSEDSYRDNIVVGVA